MIIGLLVFLYLVIGFFTAILLVRFGGYNPGKKSEPTPILVIVAWPFVAVVMGVIGCNDLLNKMLASAKKEDNEDLQ